MTYDIIYAEKAEDDRERRYVIANKASEGVPHLIFTMTFTIMSGFLLQDTAQS